jgi:hypothetical protein
MIAARLGLNPLGPRAGIRRSIVVITNKGITPIVQPGSSRKIKKSAIGDVTKKNFYFCANKKSRVARMTFCPC